MFFYLSHMLIASIYSHPGYFCFNWPRKSSFLSRCPEVWTGNMAWVAYRPVAEGEMQLKVIEWEEQDKENNNDRLNTVRSRSSRNSNTAEFHLCGCSQDQTNISLAYTVWGYELLNFCHKQIYMNLHLITVINLIITVHKWNVWHPLTVLEKCPGPQKVAAPLQIIKCSTVCLCHSSILWTKI